ncbi:hypothetical protein DL96DRAFT_1704680 [Flagelloscypha sp. PMI_526]|nr:hypothetical protein DL96DRAFT_1704680 [Flagelloscypha sp. PMI_526]
MTATTSLEQVFPAGFLEIIIRERAQKVLDENTKEVEERKNAEIKVCEDRIAVLEQELINAGAKIAALEKAQAIAAQDTAQVLGLVGRLQQHFVTPPASATNLISPSPSLNFVHVGTTSEADTVIVKVPAPTHVPTAIPASAGDGFGWRSAPKTTTQLKGQLEEDRGKKEEQEDVRLADYLDRSDGEGEKVASPANDIPKEEEKKEEEDDWGFTVKKTGGKKANEKGKKGGKAEEVQEKEPKKEAPKASGFGWTGGSAWGAAATTDKKDGWTTGGKKGGGAGGLGWSGRTW